MFEKRSRDIDSIQRMKAPSEETFRSRLFTAQSYEYTVKNSSSERFKKKMVYGGTDEQMASVVFCERECAARQGMVHNNMGKSGSGIRGIASWHRI